MEEPSEEDLLRLRGAGYNTVLLSLSSSFLELYRRARDGEDGEALVKQAEEAVADLQTDYAMLLAADRIGFLTLARVPIRPESPAWARGLSDHACFLGWVLPQEMIEQEASRSAALTQLGSVPGHLLGVELSRPVPEEQLSGINFVCCREEVLPELVQVRLPKIVLTRGETPPSSETAPAAGLLGWIRG
jgi:hypothetical protein